MVFFAVENEYAEECDLDNFDTSKGVNLSSQLLAIFLAFVGVEYYVSGIGL